MQLCSKTKYKINLTLDIISIPASHSSLKIPLARRIILPPAHTHTHWGSYFRIFFLQTNKLSPMVYSSCWNWWWSCQTNCIPDHHNWLWLEIDPSRSLNARHLKPNTDLNDLCFRPVESRSSSFDHLASFSFSLNSLKILFGNSIQFLFKPTTCFIAVFLFFDSSFATLIFPFAAFLHERFFHPL